MQGHKVSSGAFANISYETRKYGGECINFMTALGPISREHRIPVYRKTLKTNPSSNFFAIFDNRAGYEDEISYDDMLIFGDIFIKAGITRVVAASVTNEAGYRSIVQLSHAVADTKDIDLQLTSTICMDEAKNFVFSRIRNLSKPSIASFGLANFSSRA